MYGTSKTAVMVNGARLLINVEWLRRLNDPIRQPNLPACVVDSLHFSNCHQWTRTKTFNMLNVLVNRLNYRQMLVKQSLWICRALMIVGYKAIRYGTHVCMYICMYPSGRGPSYSGPILRPLNLRPLNPVYTIQPAVNRFDNRLYRVNKHSTGCQYGCQTGVTTGLTTGCIQYTIQLVVKPV